MLDRSNVELLILATTFLKKLSIYKENKVGKCLCIVKGEQLQCICYSNMAALLLKPCFGSPLLQVRRCKTCCGVHLGQHKQGMECNMI